jgi:hypothetical protein
LPPTATQWIRKVKSGDVSAFVLDFVKHRENRVAESGKWRTRMLERMRGATEMNSQRLHDRLNKLHQDMVMQGVEIRTEVKMALSAREVEQGQEADAVPSANDDEPLGNVEATRTLRRASTEPRICTTKNRPCSTEVNASNEQMLAQLTELNGKLRAQEQSNAALKLELGRYQRALSREMGNDVSVASIAQRLNEGAQACCDESMRDSLRDSAALDDSERDGSPDSLLTSQV